MEIKQIYVKYNESGTIAEWAYKCLPDFEEITPYVVAYTGRNFWQDGDEKLIIWVFDELDKAWDFVQANDPTMLRVFDWADLRKGVIWRNEDRFAEFETIFNGIKLICWIVYDDSGADLNAVYVAGSRINVISLISDKCKNVISHKKAEVYESFNI